MENLKSFFHVEKDLVPIKGLFFFYYGAAACLLPFLPIWYTEIGLTHQQIGILGSMRLAMSLIGPPAFGALADKSGKHKLVLVLTTIVASLLRISLLPASMLHSFSIIAGIILLGEFVASNVVPLLDSMVLAILTPAREQHYGRQRMFGTIAAGTIGLTMGTLAGRISNSNFYFYAFAILIAVFTTLSMFFPMQGSTSKSDKKNPVTFSQGLKRLFGSVEASMFFFVMTLAGMVNSLQNNFLFVFLKSLEAPSSLLGLCIAFSCLSEVPCLFFSGYVIEKLTSEGVFCLALGAFGFRLGIYSLLTNPYFVLCGELLNGITFGFLFAAGVRYVKKLAPPELGSSAQGIMIACNCFGGTIGGIVGGSVYTNYGPRVVFAGGSMVAFLGMTIYGSFQIIKRLRANHKSQSSYVLLDTVKNENNSAPSDENEVTSEA